MQAEAAQEDFVITPRDALLGADVSNIDLSEPLADRQIDALLAALTKHKVLFFHDQYVDTLQHTAFARRFGELEVHPFILEGAGNVIGADPNHPELVVVESLPGKSTVAEVWHSDTTWRDLPSMGSILRMTIAPESGGDTMWADMTAVYRGLDDETRALIDDAVAIHDWRGFARTMRAHNVDETKIAALREKFPPAEHPVVRTHPVTGERLVYVNSPFTVAIKGMNEEESDRLLAHLYAETDRPEYRVTLRWKKGTIAFWDNRSTQHMVQGGVVGHRRLERLTIVGDKPF